MSSLKDVARLAHVSVATVSRVLNKSSLVEASTYHKVEDAMRLLDYRPNLLATGLRAKNGRLIGLVVPESIHYTFASFIQHIGDHCFQQGYSLLVGNHHDDPATEEEIIDTFYRRNIDGLILSLVSDESRVLSMIAQSSVPTVVLDRVMYKEPYPSVTLDNYQAGRLMGDHFASLGHKDIGCVTGPLSIRLCRERLQGFRDALESHGIHMPNYFVVEGTFYFESGFNAAQKIFGREEGRPTAIWAQNDLMATGILKHVISSGYSVPREISIAGMDDIGLASMISPSLTTIAQPFSEMSKCAVDLILDMKRAEPVINGGHNFEPKLIIRDSTATNQA
jgi:DNA-binding LacI/PurR family transcriptional regulator